MLLVVDKQNWKRLCFSQYFKYRGGLSTVPVERWEPYDKGLMALHRK